MFWEERLGDGWGEAQKRVAGGWDMRNRVVVGRTASAPSVFCPRLALFMQDRKGLESQGEGDTFWKEMFSGGEQLAFCFFP